MIYIAKTGVRVPGTDLIKCQGNAEPVRFPPEIAKAITSFSRPARPWRWCLNCSATRLEGRSTGDDKREEQKKDAAAGLGRHLLRGALIYVA